MKIETLDYAWETAKGMVESAITQYIRDLGHGVDLHEREYNGVRFHSINYSSRSNGRNAESEITYSVSVFKPETGTWESKTIDVHSFSCDEMFEIIEALEEQESNN